MATTKRDTCKAITADSQTGSKVKCQKCHDHLDGSKFTGPMAPVHTVDGFMWREGDHQPKRFAIEGLWLTGPGGRIVKPGWGEYASEQGGDILLLSVEEIQHGVQLEEFEKRLKAAKEQRNQRHAPKQGKNWALPEGFNWDCDDLDGILSFFKDATNINISTLVGGVHENDSIEYRCQTCDCKIVISNKYGLVGVSKGKGDEVWIYQDGKWQKV